MTKHEYWNKLKQRLKEKGFEPMTNCHQLNQDRPQGGFPSFSKKVF